MALSWNVTASDKRKVSGREHGAKCKPFWWIKRPQENVSLGYSCMAEWTTIIITESMFSTPLVRHFHLPFILNIYRASVGSALLPLPVSPCGAAGLLSFCSMIVKSSHLNGFQLNQVLKDQSASLRQKEAGAQKHDWARVVTKTGSDCKMHFFSLWLHNIYLLKKSEEQHQDFFFSPKWLWQEFRLKLHSIAACCSMVMCIQCCPSLIRSHTMLPTWSTSSNWVFITNLHKT